MPAPVNRTLISRGPAYVKFADGIFYSKEDITLDWGIANTSVPSSQGDVFSYRSGIGPALTVPLVGEIEHLNILFPFGSKIIGSSVFSNVDIPLEIIPLDPTQKVVVFHSAAVIGEPELVCGVSGGAALGSTIFRFLPKLGAALTDNEVWYRTRDQQPGDAPTGFDPAKILIQSYDIHWLSGGKFALSDGTDTSAELLYNITPEALENALNLLTDITTAGGVTVSGNHRYGWRVTFVDPGGAMPDITGSVISGMPGGSSVSVQVIAPGSVDTQRIVEIRINPWSWLPSESAVKIKTTPKIEEQKADAVGFYDLVFNGTEATATFLPLNVSQEVLFAAAHVQGPGAALGANFSGSAHNLVVTAPGLTVTLFGAVITNAGGVWSSSKQRVPETEWKASRTITGNVVGPLYTITAEA